MLPLETEWFYTKYHVPKHDGWYQVKGVIWKYLYWKTFHLNPSRSDWFTGPDKSVPAWSEFMVRPYFEWRGLRDPYSVPPKSTEPLTEQTPSYQPSIQIDAEMMSDALRYRELAATSVWYYSSPPMRAISVSWMNKLTKKELDVALDKRIKSKRRETD